MGNVIILPNNFSTRHKQTLMERETALAILQKESVRLKRFRKQFAELSIRQEVLKQSEIIEDFHARLESHRKARPAAA